MNEKSAAELCEGLSVDDLCLIDDYRAGMTVTERLAFRDKQIETGDPLFFLDRPQPPCFAEIEEELFVERV